MADPYEKYIASAPKQCCVCGVEFSATKPSITKEFTGEYYSFCSSECIAAFEGDPEKFTRNGEEDNDE